MADVTNKTFNVRIKNKYDSYENWVASSVKLEAGEIAIAYTTIDVAEGNGTAKHPALLMKVGDGEKTFANLPWLSAKAADVADWAKAEKLLATNVEGLDQYIAGKVQDTDTQYRIVKVDSKTYKLQSKAIGGDFADIEGMDNIVIPDVDFTDVNEAIAGLQGLHADATEGEGKMTVSEEVNGIIAGLDLVNTYASKSVYDEYVINNDKAVKANTDAIALLNKDDQTKGSIDYKIAQEVAKIINDNDDADIDTLNEIAAWITNDITGVGGLVEQVTANTGEINAITKDATITTFKGIEDKIGGLTGDNTVAEEIAAAKTAAINEAKYDETAVTGRLTALEGLHADADEGDGKKTVSEEVNGIIAELDLVNTYAGKAYEQKVDNLKIEDLGQAENTYIVFDCGTASTII